MAASVNLASEFRLCACVCVCVCVCVCGAPQHAATCTHTACVMKPRCGLRGQLRAHTWRLSARPSRRGHAHRAPPAPDASATPASPREAARRGRPTNGEAARRRNVCGWGPGSRNDRLRYVNCPGRAEFHCVAGPPAVRDTIARTHTHRHTHTDARAHTHTHSPPEHPRYNTSNTLTHDPAELKTRIPNLYSVRLRLITPVQKKPRATGIDRNWFLKEETSWSFVSRKEFFARGVWGGNRLACSLRSAREQMFAKGDNAVKINGDFHFQKLAMMFGFYLRDAAELVSFRNY